MAEADNVVELTFVWIMLRVSFPVERFWAHHQAALKYFALDLIGF